MKVNKQLWINSNSKFKKTKIPLQKINKSNNNSKWDKETTSEGSWASSKAVSSSSPYFSLSSMQCCGPYSVSSFPRFYSLWWHSELHLTIDMKQTNGATCSWSWSYSTTSHSSAASTYFWLLERNSQKVLDKSSLRTSSSREQSGLRTRLLETSARSLTLISRNSMAWLLKLLLLLWKLCADLD